MALVSVFNYLNNQQLAIEFVNYAFYPSSKIRSNSPNDNVMISKHYGQHYNAKSSIIQLNSNMSQDIREIKIS